MLLIYLNVYDFTDPFVLVEYCKIISAVEMGDRGCFDSLYHKGTIDGYVGSMR